MWADEITEMSMQWTTLSIIEGRLNRGNTESDGRDTQRKMTPGSPDLMFIPQRLPNMSAVSTYTMRSVSIDTQYVTSHVNWIGDARSMNQECTKQDKKTDDIDKFVLGKV